MFTNSIFNNSSVFNDINLNGVNADQCITLIKTASHKYVNLKWHSLYAVTDENVKLPLTGNAELMLFLVKQVVRPNGSWVQEAFGYQAGRNGPFVMNVRYANGDTTKIVGTNDSDLQAFFGFIPIMFSFIMPDVTSFQNKAFCLAGEEYIWNGTADATIDNKYDYSKQYNGYIYIWDDGTVNITTTIPSGPFDTVAFEADDVSLMVAYHDNDLLLSVEDKIAHLQSSVTNLTNDLSGHITDANGKFRNIDDQFDDVEEAIDRIEGDQSNLFISR